MLTHCSSANCFFHSLSLSLVGCTLFSTLFFLPSPSCIVRARFFFSSSPNCLFQVLYFSSAQFYFGFFFRVCRCSFSWVWDLAWIGHVCVFREIVFGGATITISIFIGLPSSKSVCNKPTVSCCSFFRWCPVYFVYSYSSLFILSLHTHSSKKTVRYKFSTRFS